MDTKRFNTRTHVGKTKYIITYHDGIQRHKDGSNFYDIRIFKNKKQFETAVKELKENGYTEE